MKLSINQILLLQIKATQTNHSLKLKIIFIHLYKTFQISIKTMIQDRKKVTINKHS